MCIGGFAVYYRPYLLYLRSTIWGLSLRNETKMILAFQELFCFISSAWYIYPHALGINVHLPTCIYPRVVHLPLAS